MTDETTEIGPPARRRRSGPQAPVKGLVVLWAPHDPTALGAFLPVAGPVVLGRGAETPLWRMRPGSETASPPLRSPRLSRRQLRLEALAGGRLSVENLGRAALRLGGARVAQGTVGPGELVEIEESLLLLCAERPRPLPVPIEAPAADFPWGEPDACGLVGESPAMWALRGQLAFVGPRPGHVLVLGPSGSGKELVAGAVHRLSPRAARPFVARNAATIPATLMEAELFGHARHYPNAGMPERDGLVGEAQGGTLLLDEVGELPVAQQAALLRLMDSGDYQRLGEARSRRADLRVVAATNRPRESLKADFLARFRHVVEVPPLAERREDLPLLVRHLLHKAGRDDARLAGRFFDPETREPRVAAELMEAVVRHPLELQVRALDALLWRGLAQSPGEVVELPPDEVLPAEPPPPGGFTDPQEVSALALREALAAHGGIQEKVWRALGLQSRYVLRRLLKKHGLEG